MKPTRKIKKERVLESLNKILKERKKHYFKNKRDADVNLNDLINLSITIGYVNKTVDNAIEVKNSGNETVGTM